MSNIILTGGGTLGHCVPNLCLIPHLKNYFDNVYYVGSKKGIEKDVVEKNNVKYYAVSTAKLQRKFTLKNFTIPFKLLKGVNESKKILAKLKPDVVFSKGGYVGLPLVIACKRKKIPIVIHESDYTIGLANKISLKYADKILTAFKDTSLNIEKAIYTGSPIRNLKTDDVDSAFSFFGFNKTKPVLLILGGSLGSTYINKVVDSCIEDLLKKFNVIHVTGKGNKTNIQRKNYYQTEFLDKMEYAYTIANVCVSRAGSNALFELIASKIPTVAIPLPKGNSRGDQVLNAEYFYKKGLITMISQKLLTKESLIFSINSAFANKKIIDGNFNGFPIKDQSKYISKILSTYIK